MRMDMALAGWEAGAQGRQHSLAGWEAGAQSRLRKFIMWRHAAGYYILTEALYCKGYPIKYSCQWQCMSLHYYSNSA